MRFEKRNAAALCKVINYGDWFLIYKLGQNMDHVAYANLIRDLAENFQNVDLERRLSTLELPPKAPPESPLSGKSGPLLTIDMIDSSPGG